MNRRDFIKILSIIPFIGYLKPIYSKIDYPKTAKELQKWMESVLPVGESTCCRHSITGEEYIEYGYITGIKSEERLCRSHWNTFIKQINNLQEEGYKLYWRIKPEYMEYVDTERDSRNIRFGVDKSRLYTRYLISNKPHQVSWKEGNPIYVKANPEWKVQIGD